MTSDTSAGDGVRAVASTALDEMDYRDVEGSFGQTFSTSIPCQLRFTETPTQDTAAFHEALDERGYARLDSDADRKHEPGRPSYEGEVLIEETYTRVKVLVFRGGVVRLFPYDDHVPTVGQLVGIVEALEVGFGASLEHDPIDRDSETEG